MIYLLLITYQLKHFICDYPLQGKFMLGKFKKYPDFILPLLAHSGVHGVATFLIAYCVKPKIAFQLALCDMVIHFTMDRIKASPNLLGRYKALSGKEYMYMTKQVAEVERMEVKMKIEGSLSRKNKLGFKEIKDCANRRFKGNTYFWFSLGFDQMVHHLTHYAIIWRLLS